jgi:hypothetical protein
LIPDFADFSIPKLEFLAKIVQDDKMAENYQFLTGILKDSFDLEESFGVPAILPSCTILAKNSDLGFY